MQALNKNTDNLYFTYTCNATQIPYLDLMIIKNPDGTLGTDLYQKPTAGNTLLHALSAHPKSLVCSIPFAQYLCLHKYCAQDEDFLLQAASLRESLLLSGYSCTSLRRAFNRANEHTRTSVLFAPPCTTGNNTAKVITKFSAHHGQLRNILGRHWHLLTDHHILSKNVRTAPELVCPTSPITQGPINKQPLQTQPSPHYGPRGTSRCG